MNRLARTALTIDIVADAAIWKKTRGIRSTLRRAIGQAAAILSTTAAEVAIVLTDDSAIRSLNRLWRGIDRATNVLSFPNGPPRGDDPVHLGDIVLAYETIAREAATERKPFAHHAAHLAIHGYLHLLGYDHETDADAVTMETTERNILRPLGIPDPYREAAKPGRKAGARPAQAAGTKARTLPRIRA